MNKNRNSMPRAARAAFATVGAASLLSLSYAQEEEEIFELPAFQVDASSDTGYQSSNTNSVNLISTPIKDTPVSIEVLNGEVLRDLGLDDVNSAIDFATNAGNNGGEEGLQRNMNFRGLTTRFMRRNNFIWYTKSDNFSTDRVEVVRGPAALLYGDGEPGGLVNITTKKANMASSFGEVGLTIGSEGQRRATIDGNVPIIDGMLGMRIAGVKEDSDQWAHNTHLDKEGIYGSVLFHPIDSLFITAEAEIVDTNHKHTGIIPLSQPPGADRTYAISDLGWINNPDVAGGSLNYENMTSLGTNFSDRIQDWESYLFKAEWSPIENLTVELSYNTLEQNTNEHRFNGSAVVYAPDEGGNPTGEHAVKWSHPERFNSENTLTTKRAVATYAFELGETSHRITGGMLDESDEFYGLSERPYNSDTNGYLGATNDGWHALSQGPINFDFSDIPSDYEWANDYWGVGWQKLSPDGNEAQGFWHWKPSSNFGGEWSWVTPTNVPNSWYSPIHDKRFTKAYFGALSSEFLDGKLKTLVGLRKDDYHKVDIRRGLNLLDEAKAESLNGGFTYQVTDQMNAYFNYSETFKSTGSFRRDPYNNSLPPAFGSGIEGGLKFDLHSGWSGIVTYFKTDFEGDVVGIGTSDRDIIDPDGLNGRFGSTNVTADTSSEGVEIQAVGSPVKNLTVSLGFSYTDAETSSGSPYQIIFNDAFMEDGNGNALTLKTVDGVEVAGVVPISDIELNEFGQITNGGQEDLGLVPAGKGTTPIFVNQVTGQPTGFWDAANEGERTSPYAGISFNAWGRYTFTEGAMKDWFVGGSIRTTMDNYAGYTGTVDDGNRTLHKRPDLTLFGAFGGYEKDFENMTLRLQLNIDNLLDKKYEYGFYAARWLQAPRTYKLTTTFKF